MSHIEYSLSPDLTSYEAAQAWKDVSHNSRHFANDFTFPSYRHFTA